MYNIFTDTISALSSNSWSKYNQKYSQGCSAPHLWNHTGFKQQLWCLPKLGKGTLCTHECTNTWDSLCSQDLCTTGTCTQTPGDKANFAMEENTLKHSKKHESKNHPVVLLSPSFWPSTASPRTRLLPALPHPPGQDRGKHCQPQINLMQLIILAVHCSLPEQHPKASVLATTAWNFVRQNPGTLLALGLSPVLCWMRNGSKITRVQKSKYRACVTLLQNCATQQK